MAETLYTWPDVVAWALGLSSNSVRAKMGARAVESATYSLTISRAKGVIAKLAPSPRAAREATWLVSRVSEKYGGGRAPPTRFIASAPDAVKTDYAAWLTRLERITNPPPPPSAPTVAAVMPPSGGGGRTTMLREWLTPVAGDVVLIQTRAPSRGKTGGVQNIRETWRVARMMGGRTAASVSTKWKRALGRETVKRRFVGTHRAFALSAAFSKMSDADLRAKFKTVFSDPGLDLARMSALTKGGSSLPTK